MSDIGAAVVLLGTIDVNITALARERRQKIKKETGNYPPYMKFDVDIELTMSSTKGDSRSGGQEREKEGRVYHHSLCSSTSVGFDLSPS